jgi:hypothetical protein
MLSVRISVARIVITIRVGDTIITIEIPLPGVANCSLHGVRR